MSRLMFKTRALLAALLLIDGIQTARNHKRKTSGDEFGAHLGEILVGKPIRQFSTATTSACLLACSSHSRCASANIIFINRGQYVCEIFNITMDDDAKQTVPSTDGYFVELIREVFWDCKTALRLKRKSGILPLNLGGHPVFNAYCDMDTDDGGWTLVQRRIDDGVDFNLSRADYDKGFGNIEGNFWIGLYRLRQMSKGGNRTLRFDMWDDTEHRYAKYLNVTIGKSENDFRLNFTSYEGTAGDALTNGERFSTNDLDVDGDPTHHCAQLKGGGWWFGNSCGDANPNGLYLEPDAGNDLGIEWEPFRGEHYSLARMEIKIKKRG